ncbi:hypothetical protein CASFOL_017520 [Castilleja foliolosa]|uniref:TcmA/NAT10 helicase domain-containing protein n=1 Tax=Castilleja foliolosa TaxID=1961234 RepID=A0ABD3DB93_9LAMI
MKLTHFMSTMIRFCIAQIRPAIFDLTLRCADPPVLASLLLGVNDFILLLSSSSLSSSSSDPVFLVNYLLLLVLLPTPHKIVAVFQMICAIALSQSYEGTQEAGRSLSLKLLQQLEEQYQLSNRNTENIVSGRLFKKIELSEFIRYASGDPIESWLNGLLCLDRMLRRKFGVPSTKRGSYGKMTIVIIAVGADSNWKKAMSGVAHLVTNVQKTNWDVRVNVHHPDQVLNMKEPYSSKGTDDLRKHWAECFLEVRVVIYF